MQSIKRAKGTLVVVSSAAALMAAAGSVSAQWAPTDEPRVWWEVGQQAFNMEEGPTEVPPSSTYAASLVQNSGRLVTAIRNKIVFVHPVPDPLDPGKSIDPIERAKAWAEFVCLEIQRRQLTEGNVAIQPIDFGAGGSPEFPAYEDLANTLFFHVNDDLEVPSLTAIGLMGCSQTYPPQYCVYKAYHKPWLENGIAATQAWMEAFCERYNELRAESLLDVEAWDIPLPSKFMLDVESPAEIGNINSPVANNAWHVQKEDSRWNSSSHKVLGLGSNPAVGMTLYDYWTAAGSPVFDGCEMTLYEYMQDDRWAEWAQRMQHLAFSAAIKVSTSDVITSYWPNCKISNYQMCATDGLQDPDLPPFNRSRDTTNTGGDGDCYQRRTGVKTVWASEDPAPYMHAPLCVANQYLYTTPASPATCRYCSLFTTLGITNAIEKYKAALLLSTREDVEAIVNSYGGQDPATISPYISFPEVSMTYGPQSLWRKVFAQYRSLGVKEFNLWSSDASQYGSVNSSTAAGYAAKLLHLLDQVWSTEVEDVSVITGTQRSSQLAYDKVAMLHRAEWDLVSDDKAIIVDGTTEVVVEAEFYGKLENYDRFRVVVESAADDGNGPFQPNIDIQLYDYASASFVTVPSTSTNWWPSSPYDQAQTVADVSPRMDLTGCTYPEYYDFISDNGGVTVRVRLHDNSVSSIAAAIDLVQVYQLDDGILQALDADDDGDVDADDQYLFTNQIWLNYSGSPCEASGDYDGDGISGISDIFAYTNAWLEYNGDNFKNTD